VTVTPSLTSGNETGPQRIPKTSQMDNSQLNPNPFKDSMIVVNNSKQLEYLNQPLMEIKEQECLEWKDKFN